MRKRFSRLVTGARAGVWGFRRGRLYFLAKTEAFLQGSQVDLAIDRPVRLGRGVRVTIGPGARVRLRIAADSEIGDRVTFDLRAQGSIEIGPRVQIREGSRLVADAPIRLMGDNRVSWDCRIFSTYGVEIGERTGLAQNVTIVDNRHFFGPPPQLFWKNVEGGPVTLGRDVWIAPGAVVTAGVSIGEHCVVGANSVVTRSIGAHRLAVGIPAQEKPLGKLDRSDCPGASDSDVT